MRGEPNFDGAVEKCLCKRCGDGELTWVKVLMDIVKDASRCEAGNCSVQAESVRWMR
jgi:hypothetical protein